MTSQKCSWPYIHQRWVIHPSSFLTVAFDSFFLLRVFSLRFLSRMVLIMHNLGNISDCFIRYRSEYSSSQLHNKKCSITILKINHSNRQLEVISDPFIWMYFTWRYIDQGTSPAGARKQGVRGTPSRAESFPLGVFYCSVDHTPAMIKVYQEDNAINIAIRQRPLNTISLTRNL